MAKSTDIPFRYATAWLDAAQESGVLAEVRRDIEGLQKLMDSSEELGLFLQDRSLTVSVKQGIIGDIFQEKVQQITLNFVLLTVAKKRERFLSEILIACVSLLDELDGIVNADVISTVKMAVEQTDALQTKLEAYTGKTIRMHSSVDPGLIGGFIAKVGDTVFDSSLHVHMQSIRQALVGR